MNRPTTNSRRDRNLLVLSVKLGPFVGGLIFWTIIGLLPGHERMANPLIMFHPVALLLAYLFGLVPAALSAMLSAAVADAASSRARRLFGALLAGAVSTVMFPFTLIAALALGRGVAGVLAMVVSAALASLVCVALVDRPERESGGYRARI